MNTPHNYTDERILAELSRTLTIHHLTLSDSAWEVEDASPEAKIQFARAFLAALPQVEQPADPYARLKAYNEARARIRVRFDDGELGEWRTNHAWSFDSPVDRYEVHPDDLHLRPEYAPAKPWSLPAPPAGRRWHREDWTADMLPEGWRPLLEGETVDEEDEVWAFAEGPWKNKTIAVGGVAYKGQHHFRTRRPLPTPSAEPEQAKPATFEAHGKTWTRHTSGDPCPCDPEAEIEWLMPYEIGGAYKHLTTKAGKMDWKVPVAFRLVDEPAQAPAAPKLHPILTLAQDQLDATPEMRAAAEAVLNEEVFSAAPTEAAEAEEDAEWVKHLEELRSPLPVAWTPRPGDVVRLKSGGPEMTVATVPDEAVVTQWFDGATLQSSSFLSINLELVRP